MNIHFEIPEPDDQFYWYHEDGKSEVCKLVSVDGLRVMKFTDGRRQRWLPRKDGYLAGPIPLPYIDERGRVFFMFNKED